jgi:hypothetical protein
MFAELEQLKPLGFEDVARRDAETQREQTSSSSLRPSVSARKNNKRRHVAISESYQVVVTCDDEAQQREVYERLTAEGRSCRLLML